MTLYLKYRPKNLDELDLPEVGTSLKKIVNSGKIPHAFLFAGPKGTGKTSAARILAKIINCENLGKDGNPCDKCEQCLSITNNTNLDVIEMDAASHRGIDDIRTLKDAVKLAPSKAKKKVYIIDEAHMLTTEASNALLKTLEEPPEHVVFILATTNPEKLIETIRSRTTLISFRKANTQEIVSALKKISEMEKIQATEEIFNEIAQIAGGAFRDAIKILEQYSLEGEEYLLKYKASGLDNFIKYLVDRNEKSAIEEIEKNVQVGITMDVFVLNLLDLLHKSLLSEVGLENKKIDGINKTDLTKLIDLFSEAYKSIVDSPIEQIPVELAVVKWCESSDDENKTYIKKEEDNFQDIPDNEPKKVEAAPVEEVIEESISTTDVVVPPNTSELMITVNSDIWKKILSEIHPVNVSIEGLLRSSQPVAYDGKTLTLGVFYKFHKERLEDAHHRKILETVLEKVLNCPTRVICTLVEPPPKNIINEAKVDTVLTETKDKDIIKAAEEIFGN